MAGIRELQKRIKSVKNIAKITKAMEMVAASKMRQAQAQALASRMYARKLDEILAKIANITKSSTHPLLNSQNPDAGHALVIISTDKGLTGSLNTNLFKSIIQFQQEHQAKVYTIGKLAKEFAIKSNFDLVAQFGKIDDDIKYESTQAASALLMKEFLLGNYSKIYVAYMDFVSTLSQIPRIVELLPIAKQLDEDKLEELSKSGASEYVFEPDPKQLLDWILPYSVELTLYQSLLEARASEHSARMVAMKNASENANELGGDLNLQFNRSRQASITSELSDMVTATMSVTS